MSIEDRVKSEDERRRLHNNVFATEGPNPREVKKSHLLLSIRILPEFHSGLEIALLITTLKELFTLALTCPAPPQPPHFFYHFAYVMLEFSLTL